MLMPAASLGRFRPQRATSEMSCVSADASLTRDSVLAFHAFALVNPRRIRVGATRRVRRELPGHIEVIRDDLPVADRTVYDGLPSHADGRKASPLGERGFERGREKAPAHVPM